MATFYLIVSFTVLPTREKVDPVLSHLCHTIGSSDLTTKVTVECTPVLKYRAIKTNKGPGGEAPYVLYFVTK